MLVPGDYCSIHSENQLAAMSWVPLDRAYFQRVSVFVHERVYSPYAYRFIIY